jgi:EAL domain-containing protein (putative c-di-GMP-specific phosphodiesterase class I)
MLLSTESVVYLQELKQMGFRLSIDDLSFQSTDGSDLNLAFENLLYLLDRRLSVDEIKLDGTFLQKMIPIYRKLKEDSPLYEDEKNMLESFKYIMSKVFSIELSRLVIEKVENYSQLLPLVQILKMVGKKETQLLLQGYGISRPFALRNERGAICRDHVLSSIFHGASQNNRK